MFSNAEYYKYLHTFACTGIWELGLTLQTVRKKKCVFSLTLGQYHLRDNVVAKSCILVCTTMNILG